MQQYERESVLVSHLAIPWALAATMAHRGKIPKCARPPELGVFCNSILQYPSLSSKSPFPSLDSCLTGKQSAAKLLICPLYSTSLLPGLRVLLPSTLTPSTLGRHGISGRCHINMVRSQRDASAHALHIWLGNVSPGEKSLLMNIWTMRLSTVGGSRD